MQVTVSQQNLKTAVGLTEKVVAKNTSLPILNNILIKTEGGMLRFSATNLEIGITTVIGVKIEEAGEITVPARIFNDFISNTSDERITLTTKNNTLFIQTDHYKTHILGLDSKDFPIIPKIKNNPVAIVSARDIKNAFVSVLDSVALSDARPELAGVYMQTKNNNITIASTDSFRLTEVVIPAKTTENTVVILPRNTVAELIRVCGDMAGDIEIKYADNQIVFCNNDVELVSRVIDGNYPPYKNVIPEKSISSVLIKKDDLEKNVRLAGLFSPGNSDIKISAESEKITIIAKNPDKGEIETTVAGLLKGAGFMIGLNFHYILGGLKHIPSSDVIIEYTGEGSPFVIKPSGMTGITYIVMPLRG